MFTHLHSTHPATATVIGRNKRRGGGRKVLGWGWGVGGESKVEIKLKRTKDKKKKRGGAAKVGTQNMRKKKRKIFKFEGRPGTVSFGKSSGDGDSDGLG